MELLEEKPQAPIDSSAEPMVLPETSQQEEEPLYIPTNPTEIVRQCIQCDASFVQEKEKTLMCLCWNCRKDKPEEIQEGLSVQKLPTLPSVATVLEHLAKS